MISTEQNSNERIPPNRFLTAGLLAWMLGVMLFGWFVLDGPGVSSMVKRVEPLKRAQQAVRHVLGSPAGETSP